MRPGRDHTVGLAEIAPVTLFAADALPRELLLMRSWQRVQLVCHGDDKEWYTPDGDLVSASDWPSCGKVASLQFDVYMWHVCMRAFI